MNTPRILLVDDDRAFRRSTAELLSEEGYEVVAVADGSGVDESLRNSRFDLILLDLRMPGSDGLDVIEAVRQEGEGIPILMISGFGTVESAVAALHLGADDFLTKPVEPEVLSSRVAALLERRPQRGAVQGSSFARMIGQSVVMREVFDAVEKVAPTEATVLITGETGTGKELVARAIHERSQRGMAPFVVVDCVSLAGGVLESELFGHVRGAFTGAVADKKGLFEAADGGTLFLDEIGDMSPDVQLRLLRAVEQHEIRPVGGVAATAVDVRVVAATRRDLREEIKAGRFRHDLFYRLNGFHIHVPPLRERSEDIFLLVESVLRRLRESRPGWGSLKCSPFVLRLLRAYRWPGNVRELLTVVESAAIRAGGGRIGAEHLPPEVRATGSGVDPSVPDTSQHGRYTRALAREDERAAIEAALEETGGSRRRAAELLGMSRTTFWRRMKHYDISSPVDPTLD